MPTTEKFDFSGWATKNDLKCSDGRTIRRNAFIECDGKSVPIVWNHNHAGMDNVLGHALLENREEGVYAYGKFNDTEQGKNAKMLVQHGDITALSIYANQLQHRGADVIHGAIREVSLVLAGANPGASIVSVNLAHGDDAETAGEIYTDEEILNEEIEHTVTAGASEQFDEKEDDSEEKEEAPKKAAPAKKSKSTTSKSKEVKHSEDEDNVEDDEEAEDDEESEDDEETIGEVYESMSDDKKEAVNALVGLALSGEEISDEEMEHSDENGASISSIIDTMSEKEKTVMYALVGLALQDSEVEHSEDYEGGDDNMSTLKHNVFEGETAVNDDELTHAEMMEIIGDGPRFGSMKESALQHGITDIDVLFPDAKAASATPDWVKRDDSWVNIFLNGVKHSPFSRVKTRYADITEADARAKGFMKGNQKFDEVFPLFTRKVDPQTIYKKQSLDRDDIIDITDFDVVSWLKTEMRAMLNEEIARAALVGDGRSAVSPDKIFPEHIVPIWTDDDVYTIKANVELDANASDDDRARAFIRAAIKSRKDYKGAGNPVMFMTEDMLTDCLLIEDLNKRVVYDTEEKLRTALRVSKIITTPVMENLTREVSGTTHYLDAIYLNLSDYTIGADKGGSVSMFDDFDIDYNKEKYLIETRCSGALTHPYSACAIEHSFK